MECQANGRYQGKARHVQHGSYGQMREIELGPVERNIQFDIRAMPTLPDQAGQCLFSWSSDTTSIAVSIEKELGLCVYIAPINGRPQIVSLGAAMLAGKWYSVSLKLDMTRRRISLIQTPKERYPGANDQARLDTQWQAPFLDWGFGTLTVAAREGASGFFNGKLESPSILINGDAVHAWDFSIGMDGETLTDRGPKACHGELHNLPTRAVRGYEWSGAHMNWADAPAEYGAIHFHDTDFEGCDWPVDISLRVPDEWQSGLYAAHLRSDGHEDYIPFIVRPRSANAPLAVLMPTFTYQIYANAIKPGRMAMMADRAKRWGGLVPLPDGFPGVGRSCYDKHSDGSGVCISSSLRPMLDNRIKQNISLDEHGSGASRIVCDSYILDWLEHLDQPYDVITDHDLHNEGMDLLAPYTTVLTGQHPEYQSTETLSALKAHTGNGGRLIYLGGNGFYWRVAHHATKPALEVRRAEGGIRVWETPPGEYHHAFNGEYGGLWRRQGQAPNLLTGVGFSAQGDSYVGHPYTFTDEILNPRVSFLRNGMKAFAIPGATFGENGWMGGGAAGFEVDSADIDLGTPPNALVIAKGPVTQDHYIPVHEDLLALEHRKPIEDLLCADMTFFETAAGGAVFSVGSMTFVGALSWDHYRSSLADLLRNVLTRFLDPAPFDTGF